MANVDLAYENGVLVKSIESKQSVQIRLINTTKRKVDVWWRDFSGRRVHYVQLDPGAEHLQDTYLTHPWESTDATTKKRYLINNYLFYRPFDSGLYNVNNCMITNSDVTDSASETIEVDRERFVRSIENRQMVSLHFINNTSSQVDIWWKDTTGLRVHYGRLEIGAQFTQTTYVTHAWEFTDVATKERYYVNNEYFIRVQPSHIGDKAFDCIITKTKDGPSTSDEDNENSVKSIESKQKVPLKFVNNTSRQVDIWWWDFAGVRVHYSRLDEGGQFSVDSFVTHPWECTDVATKQRYYINNKYLFLPPPSHTGEKAVDCVITKTKDGHFDSDDDAKKLVKSIKSKQKVPLKFINNTSRQVDLWWWDFAGVRVHYSRLDEGGQFSVDSFVTHPWECTDVATKEPYYINNESEFLPPPSHTGEKAVDCIITKTKDGPSTSDPDEKKPVNPMEVEQQKVSQKFINNTSRQVDVWSKDATGMRVHRTRLENGGQFSVDSLVTHKWECSDVDTKERYYINNESEFLPPPSHTGEKVDAIITSQKLY